MMEPKQKERENTCEGRFCDLRKELSDALSITGTDLNEQKLRDLFSLVEDNIYSYDVQDNYYTPGNDDYRSSPQITDYNSILPLLSRESNINPVLVSKYVSSIDPKIDKETLSHLSRFQYNDYLETTFSEHVKFLDFKIKNNFGIGSSKLGAITSDSPFNIEVWKEQYGFEEHLLTVGFWYRKMATAKVMLIDQIQKTRSSIYVPEAYVKGLDIACHVGKDIGMNEVWVFPANKHPMFKKHPERKSRMLDDLKQIYDVSCQKLNFEGDADTFYIKKL